MPESIVFKNIAKRYDGAAETMAVRNATFSIFSGEVTVLMGPSGSGKTTLLAIAGGLLSPTSGEVAVCGERLDDCDQTHLQKFRRTKIAFVFQSYNLLSSLTALENIEVAFSLRRANSP